MTISKKDLCIIHGITLDKNSSRKLRKKIFTDQVLDLMGMPLEQYNKIQIFDRYYSVLIIKLLYLSENELAKVNIQFDPSHIHQEQKPNS